jgi:hypothetical protein
MVIGHTDPGLADAAPYLCNGGMEELEMDYPTQTIVSYLLMCPSKQVWDRQVAPCLYIMVVLFFVSLPGMWLYKKNIIDYKPYVTYSRLKTLAPSQKMKENTIFFREHYWAICAHWKSLALSCACPYMRLLDSLMSMDIIAEEDFLWHFGCLYVFPGCYLCCYAPYYRTKMRQKLGSKRQCTCLDCCMTCCCCAFGISQLARVADKATGVGTGLNCQMYEMSTNEPIAKPVRIKRSSVTE